MLHSACIHHPFLRNSHTVHRRTARVWSGTEKIPLRPLLCILGNPQMCESTNSEPTNTGGQMQALYRHPVRFEIVQGQEQHYSKMLYLSGMLSNIEMHYPPIFRIHTPLWCNWELIQSCILQVWLIIVIVDMLWLILFTHQSQN